MKLGSVYEDQRQMFLTINNMVITINAAGKAKGLWKREYLKNNFFFFFFFFFGVLVFVNVNEINHVTQENIQIIKTVNEGRTN